MLLSFSILGIILSAISISFKARKSPLSIYLGTFFFLVSLYVLIQYAVFYSKSTLLVAVVFINVGFLTYLMGPALFLYIRALVTDSFRLKKSDLLHLLPMLIFLIGCLPYMLTPWAFKKEIAGYLIERGGLVQLFDRCFLFHAVPKAAVYLSRPLLVLAYTVWAALLLIRHFTRKESPAVLSGQRFMIKWIASLLGFIFILTVSHMLQMIQSFLSNNPALFVTLNFMQLFSGFGLAGLLISPFFFPAVLYGLPSYTSTAIPGHAVNEQENHSLTVKTGRSEFESDYLDRIGQITESCMKTLKPYLQHDCNLYLFSKISKLPMHHLAYYFKHVKKQSFNDFRNQCRVEYAKNLIAGGKGSALTLEGIGLSSGFSSRSTFYSVFMKFENMSPSAYMVKHTLP